MDEQDRIFDRARLARDPRFDGRFFIGVSTTRIYCRPICPVRPASSTNVRFFPSATAAEQAGYRPCLRCRPELAPGSPAWQGTAATASRALTLIERGFLDEQPVEALAAVLGVGSRHLRRLFRQHIGATPRAVARTRRLQTAKRLLDETAMPMTDVAFAAGFSSVRRFNAVFAEAYGRTPSAMRRRRRASDGGPGGVVLHLAYRPPFNWALQQRLLAAEAIPGVEAVTSDLYRRAIWLDGEPGWIEVRPVPGANQLRLTLGLPHLRHLREVVARVRLLFDLQADPLEIAQQLGTSPALRPWLERWPGVRLPGAWDGFEVAVRAVLVQAVGPAAAGEVLAALVRRHGMPLPADEAGDVLRVFPPPAVVAGAHGLGLPAASGQRLVALAEATAAGTLRFDGRQSAEALVAGLEALGLHGPAARWVALRSLGEPDLMPFGSPAVPTLATVGLPAGAVETWRPWRAYVAVLATAMAAGSAAVADVVVPPTTRRPAAEAAR